jgi:hypothetical protein
VETEDTGGSSVHIMSAEAKRYVDGILTYLPSDHQSAGVWRNNYH